MERISLGKARIQSNPLSSTDALAQMKETQLTTKEKELKANESPMIKSLFDVKGNSKHREDLETYLNKVPQFKNQLAQLEFGGQKVEQAF